LPSQSVTSLLMMYCARNR